MTPATLITAHLDTWTSAIKSKSSAGRGGGKKQEFHGIKKLRELILELAVRGLLVPQDPEDEPAAELLEKIRAEETRLVKAGEIKKRKLIPRIQGKEKPFELPTGWEWIRLAEAGHDWGQKKPDSDFTYIDVGAINKELGLVSNPSVLPAAEAPSRARKIVKKGTVIYSTVRPYLLNIAVVSESFDPEPIASTAFAIIHPFQGIEASFVYRYLRSPTFIEYVESCQTGIAYPAINDRQFFAGLLPLPPLAEQHRIVAKVDELMALCDQLEQRQEDNTRTHAALVETLLSALMSAKDHGAFTEAWQQIAAHFHTLFTTESSIDHLKQTILQLAVMGKLVEQEPEDEPADGMLQRILKRRRKQWNGKGKYNEPNTPNDSKFPGLPESWAWAALDQLGLVVGGLTKNSKRNSLPTKLPYLRVANVYADELRLDEIKEIGVAESEIEKLLLRKSDLLIVEGNGSQDQIGRLAIWDGSIEPCVHQNHLIKVRLVEPEMGRFIVAWMLSPSGRPYIERVAVSSSGLYTLSVGKVSKLPLPLPPLAEQQRIVTKVDELMALCDRLKACLQSTQSTQLHLAKACVASFTGTTQLERPEKMKAPKTELVSFVTLGKKPKPDVKAPLAQLLMQNKGTMPAKSLWQQSGLTIDKFYQQLKTEVSQGWIAPPAEAEMKILEEA